eukprot:c24472_g5_i5 orf=3-494(-)
MISQFQLGKLHYKPAFSSTERAFNEHNCKARATLGHRANPPCCDPQSEQLEDQLMTICGRSMARQSRPARGVDDESALHTDCTHLLSVSHQCVTVPAHCPPLRIHMMFSMSSVAARPSVAWASVDPFRSWMTQDDKAFSKWHASPHSHTQKKRKEPAFLITPQC